VLEAWLRAIARWVEESATESLPCRVLLIFTSAATFLSTFGTWSLPTNTTIVACRPFHVNVLLAIATVESSALAARPSGLVHPGHIGDRSTVVRLGVEELLRTVLLLDRGVVVRNALL